MQVTLVKLQRLYLPSSTLVELELVELIPAFCCAFKLQIRNVLLTTSNASSRVAILQAMMIR